MSPETQEDSPQDMQQLLDEMDPIRALRRGEIVEGVVMRAESDGIFINTGYKTEGFVPPTEMRTLSQEELVDIIQLLKAGGLEAENIMESPAFQEVSERATAAGLDVWNIFVSNVE